MTEPFETMEQDGEKKKSNTTTKSLKKVYGEGKCVKTNICIINGKCQHKCWEKFTENDRKYIFDSFWSLGNKPRQRNYLVKCVGKVPIKRKQNLISRRSISYKYFLSFKSEKKQVCQQFLLTTLDISQKFLLYTIKNSKLVSSEENKNHGKIVSKSKFYDSAQYDDLQEEKTVNPNGPIETINGNSLCADVSHVSNDCLPLTKKNHNINEVKSFVSKNESYLDVEESKNNTQSKIHKLPTVDKNITDIFGANSEINNACKMTIFKNLFQNSAIFKVYQFINKLPALSSRYCSASSNKKYLPTEIANIIQLYDLYKDYCKINGDEPESKYSFENIIKKQSHLGFHVPKRKKCNLCVSFKNTNSPNCEQEIQKSHNMRDEDECKALVTSHRQITDPSTVCASFDIQNVLSTPIGYNKKLYYSRKFGTSNLVIFENITQNAFCYLWGETTGNRGSNEIVSCIQDYLIKVDQRKSVTSVILLCRSSARRNKNKAMLAMMYHALECKLNFIKEIKLVFLLPGQPCMPVESLIATIDHFIKNKTVWAPSEWPTLIRNANYTNPRPLEIVEMKSSDFLDWTCFSSSIFPNHLKTDGGEKISISKLRYVLFQKEENKINLLTFNSYTNVYPEKLVMIKKRRNSKIPCYTENIGISNAKFNNLTKLCKDGIIPEK